MSRMSLVGSALLLAVAGVCASCSNFDQRWNATPPLASANPAALMAGKWEGGWESDATDYYGDLQAIAEPTTITVDDKKTVQQYSVQFRFKLQKVGFDEFSVTLNAVKGDDKRLHFVGKKDMGSLKGGLMRFDGYVDPVKDVMYLDYISDRDCGTYKLHRIVGENM